MKVYYVMSTCNGDGECSAARLHRLKYRCKVCQCGSFDHDTESPERPFCLDCGKSVPLRYLERVRVKNEPKT